MITSCRYAISRRTASVLRIAPGDMLLAATLIAAHASTAHAQATRFPTRAIDAVIDSAYKPDQPGGVVLVARGDRILHHRAFGMANLEWNAPMTTDALFSIASMTKQFTAVAVLQLVEQGRLSLADTVGRFLPGYPTPIKAVTIEQLLTHTSGIANARNAGSLLAAGRGWLSAEQVMATFKDQPLDFAPGSRWSYSNAGYQLLGYIVEKVVGEPFPEYLERTLLAPAGMTRSLWGDDTRVIAHRAIPYLFVRNRVENANNANVQIAWAAGALQSTAADLLRWQRALVTGRLLRDSTLRRAWTPARTTSGDLTDYGYGWFIGTLQGHALVEHGGNMGGFMSHAMYLPDDSLLVVVLLNGRGNRLPELTATAIAAIALGKPLVRRALVVSADSLQQYVGQYLNAQRAAIHIGIEQGRLYYQRENNPRIRMTLYEPDRVFFDDTALIGEFVRDTSGRIVRLEMQTQRGQSRSTLVRERDR